MPLRFEAWTYPGSSTFEKKFDIPVAMPGSAGVRELSTWSDQSFMVPASYSRLDELVSETSGSWIKVFKGSKLIDEFDAARVSLTAGKPNTRTVSGPQRNGLVEGVGILPKDYPNHKPGAFDWKWGAENVLPDLSLSALGSIREVWELKLIGERYQLDLSLATAGTFTLNPDGIGDTAAIDWDATESQIKSALEALAGIDDVTVEETDEDSRAFWIVFDDPKDLTTDMTIDDSGITGSTTLTKFNDGFDTSTATFTITVDGQTTEDLDWDVSASGLEGSVPGGTGIQGLSTVNDVTVTGSGTFGDPWIITFHDPADPGSVSASFSAGNHQMSQETAGALDPSPITVSKPVDAGAGSEDEHGSYGDPALEVITTTPLDTDADYAIKVNAESRFAGCQLIVDVTPGETYQASIPIYPTADGVDFALPIRDIFGNPIAGHDGSGRDLASGSYQTISTGTFTIPAGVHQISFRVATADSDPAKNDTFYANWQGAKLITGEPEATWTQIVREFLEAAQDRGAGTHLEVDATDLADSLGTALSTMSYSFFWGDDAHLGQTLAEGREKGFQWQVVPADEALVITPAGTTTHVIQIYKVDADEIEDLTATSGGPTVTVGGVGVTEAQVVSRRIPYTTLIGLGTGNVSVEDSNAAAETALGRIERVRDVEHLGNTTAVQDYLDAQFAEQALNLKAATATVLETASQIPGVDYGPGSKIWWQFPGILDKEARPVKRFSWTHGLTASFRIEGSRILTGEAAVVSAVDMLLRKQGRRRDSKQAPSPTSLAGSGGGSSGAYLHLVRSSTQTIAVDGEAVTWTTKHVIEPQGFAVSLPTTDLSITQPGYYDVHVNIDWDTFKGGGIVWVTRTRGGSETTVWPPSDHDGLWTATSGSNFEGVAPAIPCESGDVLKVYVDHDDASTHDLASASVAVVLVDRISRSTSSGYRELILSHGPIAYWRLGESSTATSVTDAAIDETGNGHDGTYSGGVTLEVEGAIFGDPNTAAAFDEGTTDGVNVPLHDDLKRLDADFTVEAWVKITGDLSDSRGIVGWQDAAGTGTYNWGLHATTSGSQIAFYGDRNGVAVVNTGHLFVYDTWHHVVMTYDASSNSALLYVNGSQVDSASQSGAITDTTKDVRIGRDDDVGIDAALDEIVFYGQVLTASEVNAHYVAGKQGV